MEPRDRAPEEVSAESRFRWRLVAGCVLLAGIAMTQSAGRIVADTKLDLAVDPGAFLARAAHLWDAQGAFGQLQNQAYGYLWPMGTFHWLGSLLDLPPWVTQRLWMAAVLCVAFTGAAVAARLLGVRSQLACLLAGFAFALSPRMLSVIGPSSIEVWPSALVPWVLLPLVIGATRGSPRLWALVSAVAVAMVGGVNAVATFAVIPLGAVYLLTRRRGRRRNQLMIWWPVGVLLGTAWWLVPLFLQGAYSPPFLEYIESARVTTSTTSAFDALRGTSNWVPYIDPLSPAGSDLLRQSYLVLNSVVLLVLGLGGLTLRRNPERRFLATGTLVGLLLVTLGHLGAGQGIFAETLHTALDTVLAPLRNVHKFDPVLRLPLVVGMAWSVDEAIRRLRARRTISGAPSDRVSAVVLIACAVMATTVTAVPALTDRLAGRDGFSDVPGYWHQTAAWLDRQEDDGVALMVPGSSFGTYTWGEPRDEPLQALASSPWAVRNAIPLTPAGNIRMLNEIEQRLAEGDGGPALTAYLRRAGVSHVVVRNDLRRTAAVTDPVLVHQALDTSPGLELTAEFGPEIGGDPEIAGKLAKALVNGGWQSSYPAVEIYSLAQPQDYAVGSDSAPTVVGGPEDLWRLHDHGLLDEAPVILASDRTSSGTTPDESGVILTDGLRRVERQFANLHDATTPTLTKTEDYGLSRLVPDYELADQSRWQTVARYQGAVEVDATSSASNPNSFSASGPGSMPYSAIDDDPNTAWVSGGTQNTPPMWWVDFGRRVSSSRISVTLGANNGPEELRLRTSDWHSPILEFAPGETRRIQGPSSLSKLWIEDAGGIPDNSVSIAEVEVGEADVERELVLPALPRSWGNPDAIVLGRVADARTGCARVDGSVRCRVAKARSAEEPDAFQRSLTLAESREYELSVSARPRGRYELDRLLQADQGASVAVSSSALTDPRTQGTAMIDGDPGTTWLAPLQDIQPRIDLSFLAAQEISGLALGIERGTAARLPQKLKMTWPGGSRTVTLDETGAVRFPPILTKKLTLDVLEAEPAIDIDFAGSSSEVPVGIGELRLRGTVALPITLSERVRTFECGSGPRLQVNGRAIETSVRTSPAALMTGETLAATPCGAASLTLKGGANVVRVEGSTAFVGESVVFGSTPGSSLEPVTARLDDTGERVLSGEAAYLVTRENANPGWRADSGAKPVTFDGWRQGWSRARSDSGVTMAFAPDTAYRAGLLGGFLSAALLCLLTGWAYRRQAADDDAPVRESVAHAYLWGAGVLVAAVVLGGLLTGALVVCGAGVVWLLSRRRPDLEGWGLAALLVPPGALFALNPWGSGEWAGNSGWAPYFVLVAVSLVGFWAAWDARRGEAIRMAGRSTSR